jgi:hypothetical protein
MAGAIFVVAIRCQHSKNGSFAVSFPHSRNFFGAPTWERRSDRAIQ